jgi:hypothetical protein
MIALLGILLSTIGTPLDLRAQQTEAGSGGGIEPLNTQCLATFASGAAEELIRLCISKHGNLVKFESPAGFEHIRNGDFFEGYILCSDTGATRNGFDVGGNEGGFDDGTVDQPGGPGTLPIIVTRNSLDGRFQLVQSFTWDPTSDQVFIEMQVKNVSGVKQFNVDVMRMADLDIGENVTGDFNNEWGTTLDSVFAWNDFGSLTGTSAPQALRISAATRKTAHFASVTPIGHAVCSAGNIVSPTNGDFGGRVTYNLGNIAKNGTKTVTFTYRRY